jgi:hypothetical protein
LFFIVLAGQYFLKIHHGPTRSAFLRWGNQIQDLQQGINIWDVHEYPNPPIMALVLMPFAQLQAHIAAMTWFVFKALLTLLAIHWVWRTADSWRGQPLSAWARFVGLLLVLGPIEGDLTHGNVNLFILFLLTAGLVSFVRGRDLEAGLLISAAIACKLTPLLFVPYFAWKRAWRTLTGCILGLVLFWGVLPGLAFGFEENAAYFASWVDKMVLPYVLEGKVTSEHQNQSLPGLAHRLLTHNPSISERVGTEYFPREYHNVADLSPDLVGKLVLLLFGGFFGLIWWTCRTPLSQRRDGRLAAEFSLILLGMLLLSERTWKHHCVTLLLPGAVIAFALASRRARQTWPLWGAVAAAGLLMMSGGSGFFRGQARFGDLAQVYGCYTWALLILLTATAWLMRRPDSFAACGQALKPQAASVNDSNGLSRSITVASGRRVA